MAQQPEDHNKISLVLFPNKHTVLFESKHRLGKGAHPSHLGTSKTHPRPFKEMKRLTTRKTADKHSTGSRSVEPLKTERGGHNVSMPTYMPSYLLEEATGTLHTHKYITCIYA